MVLLQHLRRTPLSPLLLQPTGAAARGRATPRRGRLRPDGTLLRARDLPYAKGGATATALLPSTSARPTSTAIPPSGAGARGGTRGGIRLHRPRPGAARPGSAPSVRVWRHRRGPPGRRRFSGSRGTAGSVGGNYRPVPARVRGYHRPGPRHHGWCREPVLQLPNLPGPSTRRRNPAASRLRVPSRLRPTAGRALPKLLGPGAAGHNRCTGTRGGRPPPTRAAHNNSANEWIRASLHNCT